MLILDRAIGDDIVINDGDRLITVRLLEIKGWNKIRLGIVAPREVSIDRGEVRQAKERDASGGTGPTPHEIRAERRHLERERAAREQRKGRGS